jgi:hypothetical protein
MDDPSSGSDEEDYNSDDAAADVIDDDCTDDEDHASYELDITDQVLITSSISMHYIVGLNLLAYVFFRSR